MKIDRMLTIIVILLNRNRISAKELAEKFEVSVRTVYRDIETINMAGIPVISYPGNNGGFGIMENYKLSHQILTLDNMCSMVSALNGINATFEDIELEASIEKLRNLIPQDKASYLDMHMEQIIIEMPMWSDASKRKQMVKDIRYAISHSKLISMSYRNYESETSQREIEPMALVYKGYSWNLFAYCRLKSDYRIFRISRIIDLRLEEEGFERKDKTYQELEAESSDRIPVTCVSLKFVPEVRSRVEDIFDKEDIKILDTGDLLVSAEFPEMEWYHSLILSFGDKVEVVGPQSVREAFASRIKKMHEKYL